MHTTTPNLRLILFLNALQFSEFEFLNLSSLGLPWKQDFRRRIREVGSACDSRRRIKEKKKDGDSEEETLCQITPQAASTDEAVAQTFPGFAVRARRVGPHASGRSKV